MLLMESSLETNKFVKSIVENRERANNNLISRRRQSCFMNIRSTFKLRKYIQFLPSLQIPFRVSSSSSLFSCKISKFTNLYGNKFCTVIQPDVKQMTQKESEKAKEVVLIEKEIDERVYDKEFEEANDVLIEDGEISEEITHVFDKSDPKNPYIFLTKFGRLKYVQSTVPLKQQSEITKAYYIHNTFSTNFLRKILKEEGKNTIFIYNLNAHYNNANQIFASAKKMIEEFYYGTEVRPKNPFKKCSSPTEIYNLSRRIAIEQKNFLQRICIAVSNDGSLRVKGKNIPQSQLLLQHLGKQQEGSVEKHDFIVPFQHWQGIHSSEQYEHNGIPIPQLNGKKLYPAYGVWPPTQQHYLKLLAEFIEKNKHFIRGASQAIDLGSGTGVLSFILAEAAPDIKILAVDKLEAAVRCTGMNASILSLSSKIRNEIFDFTKLSKKDELISYLQKERMETSYDIIIANPPWITASPLSNDDGLETGNYDPKEKILKGCLHFASLTLNREVKRNKKGRLVLIYSDLSENLGIQNKGRIQELCDQYKFVIQDQLQTKLSSSSLFRKNDPNYGPKSSSSVLIYEITRQ